MWIIAGTVPEKNFPLYTDGIWEESRIFGNELILPDNRRLPIARGTAALAATAISTSNVLKVKAPGLLLAGDCGSGSGSRDLYNCLTEKLPLIAAKENLSGITFHYFYPDQDLHDRLFLTIKALPAKPILIADAGFMYVAKMSGYAANYDLFTPDMGELAYLADEKAPHPFYTRGFLLAEEENAPDLLTRAIRYGNCPANMIIKGKTDYVVADNKLAARITEPSIPAMECIGGTGDIVTGFATAYLNAGYSLPESSLMAARAARYLADFCKPTPASQVWELIAEIEPMIKKYKSRIEESV